MKTETQFNSDTKRRIAVNQSATETKLTGRHHTVIEPVDVIETEEGGVAQLVTAAGDQWWLRVGPAESVPVTPEYLLELLLQLRELRQQGIL